MARRVSLPLLDRRFVLRGMAAALAASLTGCRITLDEPTSPDFENELAPDASPASDGVEPGPGFERCGDALCIDLENPNNAALRAVDGARLITVDGKRLLIVRLAESTFVVLSAICTHSGCTVKYSPTRGDVVCPCHGSSFATDGRVTHGPAALPLASFATIYDATAERVTVTLA
jgi:Rieske Fe-S protein